jgi:hypothetical protein
VAKSKPVVARSSKKQAGKGKAAVSNGVSASAARQRPPSVVSGAYLPDGWEHGSTPSASPTAFRRVLPVLVPMPMLVLTRCLPTSLLPCDADTGR